VLKSLFSFLSGIGVAGTAFIALSDRVSSGAWRMALILCVVVALGGLAMQQALQWLEDRKAQEQAEEDRQDRQTHDRRLEELMAIVGGRGVAAASPSSNLREKVLQLGHDIFSFLRETGPQLRDLSRARDDEIWCPPPKEWRSYATAIHYGYLRWFKDRAVNLFNELADQQIHFDLDPSQTPEAVSETYVRNVAEECFLVAARMDIKATAQDSKGAPESAPS
jgi:hypothetical protein